MLDDTLLDDPAWLQQADTAGLLRAAATPGAQVRSTAGAAAEAGLARHVTERPRALVLLARSAAGADAAPLVTALLGPECPVPVVTSLDVPQWVGPLDVVVVHVDDMVDEPALAEGVYRAGRRGARVVVAGPADGPVAAAAAGGQAILLPTRVPVPPGLGLAAAVALTLAVADALGLLRVDLDGLADQLDHAAERDHPSHESFVNPAKSLALRLGERVPLLWGVDPVAVAVAGHGAGALAGFAGVAADATGYQQAERRSALFRTAVAQGSDGDIFADPDDLSGQRVRVLLLSVPAGPATPPGPPRADHREADLVLRRATDRLPSADLLVPGEESQGDPVTGALSLACRLDTAAVYLGLTTGAMGGSAEPRPSGV
nr:SIS domain-containing protein [Actinoalloteichus spitiensis]